MGKLFEGSSWTFPLLQKMHDVCEEIAIEDLKLDYYQNQIEIVSAEQMLDAYTSVGLPIMYQHWSFGKKFIEQSNAYQKGNMGLAFELIINSSPSIAFCMEDNSAVMQLLVIAHASFGHNSFFKSNYLFKEWTDAEGIIDYLLFAKNYIAQCEEKYGYKEVEATLDAAHTLQNVGVDRYRRPKKMSFAKEQAKQKDRDDYIQKSLNDLWRTVPESDTVSKAEDKAITERTKALGLPEENILYFLEKKSPILKGWQREILRIVSKLAQYFTPQRQTKCANEGWACFTHYFMLNRLYDKGLIDEGQYLEFIHSHTSVTGQPSFNNKGYYGLNPYSLGFAMFQDIKRISENPTSEDKEWFPNIAGGDWLTNCHYAMENFRDESFISQYLSPKVIRDFKLFSLYDDVDGSSKYVVKNIHNEDGYRKIRRDLSAHYNISNQDPDIQVFDADLLGNRELILKYYMMDGILLDPSTNKVLKQITKLWGYGVKLIIVDANTGEEKDFIKMAP